MKINSTRLFTALKEVEKSPVLNIAIGHHGLDCLNQKDSQDTINQFIDYNIDIYLCGHIHKAAYTISTDGNINIPTLTCGAAVVDDYSNAYFMVESFDGQNTLSSKCYEWDFLINNG